MSTGISKPRHVFVFIINDANIDAQTENPFLYNIFSVSTDLRTLSNCHLEVGNGNGYREIHYTTTIDMTRVLRYVLRYVHKIMNMVKGHYSIKLILVPVSILIFRLNKTENGH